MGHDFLDMKYHWHTCTCPRRTARYLPDLPHQIRMLLSKEADATNRPSGLETNVINVIRAAGLN